MRPDDGNVPPGSTSIAKSEADGDNVPIWPTGPPVTYRPSGPAGSESDRDSIPPALRSIIQEDSQAHRANRYSREQPAGETG